jgi:hypothetical protein
MLYEWLLVAHSYVRWAVVAALVVVLSRAGHGWATRRPWTGADDRTQLALVAVFDTQLLLGLGLYLHASPYVRAFFSDPAAAMRIGVLRFFGLEHPVLMLTALVLAHVGRRMARRGHRHRRALVWTAAAALMVVVGIPWPGLPQGRPWLR